MVRFAIVKLAGCKQFLDDLILPLYYGLKRLGHDVVVSNIFVRNYKNIVFGVYSYRCIDLPKNCIVFNTEQLAAADCFWNTPEYREIIKSNIVWDYSLRNVNYIRNELNSQNVVHLMPGYVPEMTRINHGDRKVYDVLFLCTINERRINIINSLKESNINIVCPIAFGLLRDKFVKQSRLILNVHFYQPANLEISRLGYLWANYCHVVSEKDDDTEIPFGLEKVCIYSSYQNIVQTVIDAIKDQKRLDLQAEFAFSIFSKFRQEKILEKIV